MFSIRATPITFTCESNQTSENQVQFALEKEETACTSTHTYVHCTMIHETLAHTESQKTICAQLRKNNLNGGYFLSRLFSKWKKQNWALVCSSCTTSYSGTQGLLSSRLTTDRGDLCRLKVESSAIRKSQNNGRCDLPSEKLKPPIPGRINKLSTGVCCQRLQR